MFKKIGLFLVVVFAICCQSNEKANDLPKIKSIRGDDIIGEFDAEKYHLFAEGINLGLEGKPKAAIETFGKDEKNTANRFSYRLTVVSITKTSSSMIRPSKMTRPVLK